MEGARGGPGEGGVCEGVRGGEMKCSGQNKWNR